MGGATTRLGLGMARGFGCLFLGLVACHHEPTPAAAPASATPVSTAPASAAPAAGVAQRPGCVGDFDPGADYFPEKITPRHARRFRLEYRRHYALLTVEPPWQIDTKSQEGSLTYVLWRCGTPKPSSPEVEGWPLVELPLRRVATTSTTELPHLVALGVETAWVGHSELDFVSAASLRRRSADGQVREIGSPTNLEALLALGPDVLFADFLALAELDRLALFQRAGHTVLMVPSFREELPLGRAEWLRLFGLLFDRTAAAEEQFAQIEKDYQALVARVAAAARPRPTVVTGGPYQDIWHVAGGKSFGARLLRDAGAAYLWEDTDEVSVMPLNLEAVMRRAHRAEFWLYPSAWRSLPEIAASDSRLTAMAAFRPGGVWANDLRLGPGGANDFWELGVTRPDLVLADLVAIFHPGLLPGHSMAFHRPLGPEPGE